MRTTPYRVIDVSGSDGIDTGRLAHLYRLLYLEKHSRLNAAFNARFFALILRTPFFRTQVFMRGERIDSFNVTYSSGGYLTSALVGYDVTLPQSLGLYRLTMMHTMLLAENRGTCYTSAVASEGSRPYAARSQCVSLTPSSMRTSHRGGASLGAWPRSRAACGACTHSVNLGRQQQP